MSDGGDLSRVTAGLPSILKIQENCYKLHACCGHTHSAIDIALGLRGRLALTGRGNDARLASIEIETYGPGYEIVKEPRPRTPYQAKFSMAYCVAVALVEGRVGLEQFEAERFGTDGVRVPTLAALLERTSVGVADDLTAKYPAAWPARVRVTLRDGSRLGGESHFPRGNPENPIDRRDLGEKFMALVSPRFGSDPAARAAAAVEGLRHSRDVSGVFGTPAAPVRP
jgi:2-methylcitrate dehydratase PrpD